MGGCLLSVMYVMLLLCTLRACVVNMSGDVCFVICAYSATCAELWFIVFRCLRGGVTMCGPRQRRNVHNDISETGFRNRRGTTDDCSH